MQIEYCDAKLRDLVDQWIVCKASNLKVPNCMALTTDDVVGFLFVDQHGFRLRVVCSVCDPDSNVRKVQELEHHNWCVGYGELIRSTVSPLSQIAARALGLTDPPQGCRYSKSLEPLRKDVALDQFRHAGHPCIVTAWLPKEGDLFGRETRVRLEAETQEKVFECTLLEQLSDTLLRGERAVCVLLEWRKKRGVFVASSHSVQSPYTDRFTDFIPGRRRP